MEEMPIFDEEPNENIIKLSECPELFQENIKMKEVKSIIKKLKGIEEENQKFQVLFDYDCQDNNANSFWSAISLKIIDISNYKIDIERDSYIEELSLDLNKKVEELKQAVFEKTKIPVNRLEFYLDEKKLDNNNILKNENLIEKKFSIKVPKVLNDIIYIKYPNEEIKEIKTDLCNTVNELLKQIDNNAVEKDNHFRLKYNIIFKDKILRLDNLLIKYIMNEDLIKLSNRNDYQICVKTSTDKTLPIYVEPSDTILFCKMFVYMLEGYYINGQRLIFRGQQLDNDKTLANYYIYKDAILHLVLRLDIRKKHNF